MQNRYIFHIALANVLWSLIPVLVAGLFHEFSIITIIFLRFFISGIIFFLIGMFLIFLNNKNASTNEMKISLVKLLKSTLEKNRDFNNMRYIYYFAILGFVGIILQIIFFFLALKTTTIAFTMIGFQLSIILVAFYEHGVKAEKLDFFKILYLIMLIFSVGIIMLVQLGTTGGNVSFMGFVYVLLFTICVSFLHVGMTKGSYSDSEIKFVNVNPNYKFIRMIIKLSLIFLTGTVLMFPFIFIIQILPFQGELNQEIELFYTELPRIFLILFRWEILLLIILSTIMPYLLIFTAKLKWSPYNLTYSQWGAILTIIEPIGGIVFGVLLINENFPIEHLVIVVFLLVMSILFRYAHESHNKVNAYLLLTHRRGNLGNLSLELLKLDGVCCVESLIGIHDIKLNIKMNSIKSFYYLVSKLRLMEEIKEIEIVFIDKIYKIT